MSDMKQERQFLLMVEPAIEKLKKYNVEELCQKGKITFDEEKQCFCVKSLNREIYVSYPDFEIDQELEMWHHLTLLQYMDTADGTALSGRNISLIQMPSGLSRGRGYERHFQTLFFNDMKDVTADEFKEACLALDAEIMDGKADVSAKLYFAPCFPVTLNFWEGDEEFPASVKVLVDENANHYLTIEGAGAACQTVVQHVHEKLTGGNADNHENDRVFIY